MATFTPLIKTWQMAGSLGRTLCVPLPVIDDKSWAPAFISILTSYPLFPYQVLGSSNSVAAGMDFANRWAVAADIVVASSGGQPRSWIVIKNPATNYQYLIHAFNDGAGSIGEVYVSCASGFTGGSTTTRPTAVDEQSAVKGVLFGASGSGLTQPRTLCVWHTTDGQQTMMVAHGLSAGGDSVSQQWFFGNIHNAPTQWTHPSFMGIGSTIDRQGIDAHYMCGQGGAFKTSSEKPASAGGGSFTPFFMGEAVHDGIGPELVPVYYPFQSPDGFRYAQALALYVNTTGFRGIMGCWPDLAACGIAQSDAWVTPPNGTNGNSPTSARTRTLIGTLLYPWDGGVWSST